MNISNLTLKRLEQEQEKEKKSRVLVVQAPGIQAEPILDVKDFFKDSLSQAEKNQNSSPSVDGYTQFLIDNDIVDESLETEEYRVSGTIGMSDLFRSSKHKLSREQVDAFSGIENVRAYLESANCNCHAKKAKLEAYYKDFVKGNETTDLFQSLKKGKKIKKIIFFHENETLLEV